MDDLQRARAFFEAHDEFVLTTHEGADADGIGAEVVLASTLKKIGKKVRILNASETPARFAFIDPDKMVETYDGKRRSELNADAALVVLDCADENNLGVISDELIPGAKRLFAVDHHEAPKNGGISGYIDVKASSTCEMTVRIAESLGVALDETAARAAYAGIVYDTGSFIYPKTSAETFQTAVKLVQSGVVPNDIYQAMYESASIGALILQKKVLSTLELHCGGRIAFQFMLKSDLQEAEANYDDAEPLINIPLRSKNVEVSILLKESLEGKLRGSLRSKGAINVSAIAQTFGGGGHRTAAGFKCAKGLAETKSEVLQKVSAALEAASLGCR